MYWSSTNNWFSDHFLFLDIDNSTQWVPTSVYSGGISGEGSRGWGVLWAQWALWHHGTSSK